MDGIDSPHIEARITELQSRVAPYENYTSKGGKMAFSFNINSIYVYISIPIIIFILLVIVRPRFVKSDVQMESGDIQTKTSLNKIIMWTFILGGVIVVAMYALNYKKRKKKN